MNVGVPSVAPPQVEEPTTLYWAYDVERAFVALLWHSPDLIDTARQELDFDLCIVTPAFRTILQALLIVHGEIAETDFVCVLHCIREMGTLEEAGGLEGLNDVFTDIGHYPEGRRKPDVIYREYVRLLKAYALIRAKNPYETLRHYTRGRGFLVRNKFATRPEHPCVVGKIPRCGCGKRCVIAGWPDGEGDGLNLTLELERSHKSHGRLQGTI
jgi:hypothetical protein